ncbi:1,4-benzoquinone reductase-like [Phaffia rhodozyma]|uniref:1,4-benzoquinone reductase-like n=1 Tax=Phaffia rhodozyma TaxID=264483 RepID=A0A0F7SJW2_PHARH|nr:1,4-benzoquinone reductase-like [Phaffia rhodozyma]
MSTTRARIGVIVYSTWGHQNTLAESVVAGIEKTGAEAVLYQIKETLPAEVLTKMYAGPKPDWPEIAPQDLTTLDGFIFCFGTRYGRAPAQVSAFFDATGGLWASGALVGKFAGVVTSSGSQHGGQETTALTTLPFFAHHGIIYVPIGFVRPELSLTDKVVGGSAWGAGSVVGGQGQLPVLEEDKLVAQYQGVFFANLIGTYLKGKHATEAVLADAHNSHPSVNNSHPDVNGPVVASSDLAALNLGAPIGTPAAEKTLAVEGYDVPSTVTTSEPVAAVESSPVPVIDSALASSATVVTEATPATAAIDSHPHTSSLGSEPHPEGTTLATSGDGANGNPVDDVKPMTISDVNEHKPSTSDPKGTTTVTSGDGPVQAAVIKTTPGTDEKAALKKQQQKKKGLFSFCCGGDGSDLKA